MLTALFSHRYYELIQTAADARLVDSHSDQQLNESLPKSVAKVVAIRAYSSSRNSTKIKWSHRRSAQWPYAARG
jgi:hypothetical protein